jgi:hypothetical protein
MARQCHKRVAPLLVSDLTAEIRALQRIIREAHARGLTPDEQASLANLSVAMHQMLAAPHTTTLTVSRPTLEDVARVSHQI